MKYDKFPDVSAAERARKEDFPVVKGFPVRAKVLDVFFSLIFVTCRAKHTGADT